MTTSVTYWTGEGTRRVEGAWENMPSEGVLWVTVEVDGYRHRLLGADGYWVHGDRYGCTYEDAEPIYGGHPHFAWQVHPGGVQPLGVVRPPPDAHVIRGVEVPDEMWADLMERSA